MPSAEIGRPASMAFQAMSMVWLPMSPTWPLPKSQYMFHWRQLAPEPPEKTFEVTVDPSAAADVLVFEGTAVSIENSPLPQSTQNYVVTMQINRVVKGQFKGKTFQFRVHSPTKSGLTLKGKYTVEAKRADGKYTVDQYQWMRRPVAPNKGSAR